MPSIRLESVNTPLLNINGSTYIVGFYDVINPNAAGISSASNTISDYVDIGTQPYDEFTIVTSSSLIISAGVTWTNTVNDCIRNIYIQYQKASTSTWTMLVGNSTRCGPSELATSWKTGNVSFAYRMFEGDKFRVMYYNSGPTTTIANVNALATGRVRPYIAIAAT
jgi:hypothetical protein